MALTDTFVKQVKSIKPSGDKHTDGGGMYLLVKPVGKYWRLDYRYLGKRKTLALGTYPEVSLAKARQRREKARELLADGIDAGQSKREEKQAKFIAAGNTFESVARSWLAKTDAKRAPATRVKVTTWLENDVFPFLGTKPIATIQPRDVLLTVRKVEERGAIESAHRVKQICGQVFRFAVAESLVDRDVTADLKGALAEAIRGHYAAITEPKEVGALMRAIFGYLGHPYVTAALKLSPLVFQRPGELRQAEWAEFNLDAAEWRIPGPKMKMKSDHLVPLSRQAVAILRDLHTLTGHGKHVFPGMRRGANCLSDGTVRMALRRMGIPKETMSAHGFRAMARTIGDEVLGFRVDLIEHQLSHAVKDPNGRAYNRTAHLPARREMMQQWADYLDTLRVGAEVIPLRGSAA